MVIQCVYNDMRDQSRHMEIGRRSNYVAKVFVVILLLR